jgi:hypothetical protein
METGRMAEKARQKKDAPKGKKPGFYSKVLDQAEQLDFELASGVEGFDDEIALLRVKIKSLLENDPENVRLILQATNTLTHLIKAKYNITKEQKQGLKEAIGNVLRDIAIPLGIKVIGNLAK